MSNSGAPYTPLGHSSLRRRVCTKKLIMLISGVSGIAILAALLQVFLLPNVKAQESNPSASANYTSPGVYPARTLGVCI
jgi:hypothetical protein